MAWAPVYATVGELQSYLQDATTSSTFELNNAIEAASRSVDRICNRQFGLVAAPEQRFYTAFYDKTSARWTVQFDDLMTSVGLVVAIDDGTYTWPTPVTLHELHPMNAAANSRPWTKLQVKSTSLVYPPTRENGVSVTAKWGWSAVPDTIKMATLIQSARLFARRQSPLGIAGNADVGQMRLMAKLDPDLAVSVQPYVRHWGAV